MWVCFYLVSAFFVAGSFACGGCRLDESKTEQTVCSSSTEKFLEHSYDYIKMTENCTIITKGKKNWKTAVESVELTILGFAGKHNFTIHYENLCEAMKDDKVRRMLAIYDIPKCHETSRDEVRERDMAQKHHKKNHTSENNDNSSRKHEGPLELKFLFEKINGNQEDSACILTKSEIVCDKKDD